MPPWTYAESYGLHGLARTVMVCTAMHGYARLRTAMHGYARTPHGHARTARTARARTRIARIARIARIRTNSHGFARICTEGTEGTVGKLSIRQTQGVSFILAESINYTI